jgi:hypothetical protein
VFFQRTLPELLSMTPGEVREAIKSALMNPELK